MNATDSLATTIEPVRHRLEPSSDSGNASSGECERAIPRERSAIVGLADLVGLDDPSEYARFSRSLELSGLQESTLLVEGITCAACAAPIEQALQRVNGVVEAQVSAAGGLARVRWDATRTRPSALIAAVRRAGYGAWPDTAIDGRLLNAAEQRQATWRLFVAAFCAMQVMMLATPDYVASAGTLDADMRRLLGWGQWVLTLPVMLFAAGPFYTAATRSLRLGRVAMELPVALGVTVAFVASTGAAFDPGGLFGEALYFDSLTMFVAVLLAARWMELRARQRTHDVLARRLAAMPSAAWRETPDGGVERVGAQRLSPGDTVRVPVGEVVPADGRAIDGPTQLDESLLSGESAPVTKIAGDALVGGSINVGAPVRMVVERVGDDTRHAAIVRLMRNALAARPAAARLADQGSAPFLLGVLLLAALTAAYWSAVEPARALPAAVAVLIVTCPCALALAAPAALVAAARGLAGRGVLLQRPDAIEPLARFDVLFVDKTGTLTERVPSVTRVHVAPGKALTRAQALATAAVLADWSAHPVAAAIAAAARQGDASPLVHLGRVREVAGHGMSATGEGDGGAAWSLDRVAPGAPAWMGDAACVLRSDGQALAAFEVDEALRAGATESLATLAADGVITTLLSGDTSSRVEALASRVGAARWEGQATPKAKLDAVAAARRQGAVVAMVGDGINDCPVLAGADVSLAMGDGAGLAQAQADLIVASGRWSDIVRARRTAQRTLAIVRQNIVWALLYNAAALPLAAAGALPPWAAGLGMGLSSLLVSANSLRAARLPGAED